MPESIRRLCVFCGSRPGANPAYAREAAALGRGLAVAGIRLVYGAGDVGLMGEVARACLGAGGEATGFIPRHLEEWEVGKRDLTEFVVTETMHERKTLMFENSDAVAVLPGGPGTLDETFEVLTWRQLGLHEKPVFLMDVDNYWAPFHALVAHVTRQEFCSEGFAGYYETVPDSATLLARL